MTTSKNKKEEKTRRDTWGVKDQNKTIVKSNNTTLGDKSKDIGEWSETQLITTQGHAIQTKQVIPKYQKKILSTSGWRMHDDKSTTEYKENKTMLG